MQGEPQVAPRWVRSAGIVAWCFIGGVVAVGIVLSALSVVSGVVLPLVFAAVLAVIFRPATRRIERWGVMASLAAGAAVVGLLALGVGVTLITVKGVTDQAQSIGDSITAALDSQAVDPATAERIRTGIEGSAPPLGRATCTAS